MKILKSPLAVKIITTLILIISVIVFFYFEPSVILRILIIFLGLIGVWQLSKTPEILILLSLYIILNDFYNIRYGLAIPLAVIMVAVFVVTAYLFYAYSKIGQFVIDEAKIFNIFLLVIGLISLEIFLVMSFWPVEPKTKSLVIAICFYVATRIFYLHINNVLNLKKAAGYILVSLFVLAGVIALSWRLGF